MATRARAAEVPALTIDPQFDKLCPALRAEELEALHAQLERDGVKDKIFAWVDPTDPRKRERILDGHHRYRWATKHDRPFVRELVDLPDRAAAIDWIVERQIGRRNLTDAQHSYMMGRYYLAKKKPVGRPAKAAETEPQENGAAGGPLPEAEGRTVLAVAEAHGVSPTMIKASARFAEALDHVAEEAGKQGEEFKQAVLTGELKATKAAVERLAGAGKRAIRKVAKAVAEGQAESLAKAMEDAEVKGESNGKHERLPKWQDKEEDIADRIAAWNTYLTRVAEAVQASVADLAAFGPMSGSQTAVIRNEAKKVAAMVRACKASARCGECEGRGCDECRRSGMVGKRAAELASR